MNREALLLLLLISCRVYGGEDSDPATEGLGFVYVCTDVAAAQSVELCWGGSDQTLAESLGASWWCRPTERHIGACLYVCPGQKGCNAFQGCWCPDAGL